MTRSIWRRSEGSFKKHFYLVHRSNAGGGVSDSCQRFSFFLKVDFFTTFFLALYLKLIFFKLIFSLKYRELFIL